MNEKKKNRRDLRNRLQRAQYVIYLRKGYAPGIARKMAREKTDEVCRMVDGGR